jgi:hypothetical protein
MSKRTKIMALVGLMLVGAFVVFMGVGGFAATASAPVTVNAGIAPTIQLTVASPVNFGAALAPGSTYNASTTATVSSNKSWGMTVTAGSLLTQGLFTIPSANLTYGVTSSDGKVKGMEAGPTQFALTPLTSNVCAGSDRGAAETLSVNYSLVVPWDVEAGSYTASHTYTATN